MLSVKCCAQANSLCAWSGGGRVCTVYCVRVVPFRSASCGQRYRCVGTGPPRRADRECCTEDGDTGPLPAAAHLVLLLSISGGPLEETL